MFGKFRGDKKLAAQQAQLRSCSASLEELEARVHDVGLRTAFSQVWPAEGVPAVLLSRLGKARELNDLLSERASMARQELPNFDEATDWLTTEVASLEKSWNAFMGLLLARLTVQDSGGVGRAASIEQCQSVLCDVITELHATLTKEIAAFDDHRKTTGAPWPRNSTLSEMQRGLDDVEGAVDVYRKRLSDGGGELPEVSTASMMTMISMLENSVRVLQEQPQNHAVHIATEAALRNADRN